MLNLVWSILFFTLQSPLLGALDIVVLDLLAAVYIVVTLPRSLMASLFFVPYALWLALATYLNIYIWIYNFLHLTSERPLVMLLLSSMIVVYFTACDYVYDPEKGDPETGIAPGTPFEDIPEDWTCPICGLYKDAFLPVDDE